MKSGALQIIQTLNQHGYQAVYAGGCVRDMLLNTSSHDIDIATNALPDTIESLFPRTLAIGKAFGVILVMIGDDEYEVATFRSDGDYGDGRHPDSVTFTTLEGDANRRDITINGMFYDPLTSKLIDVVGGRADLESKIIRFIGDPVQRIQEDKLRLLRAIRFAARLEFEIEANSLAAIKEHAHLVAQCSAERIAEELTKLISVKNKRLAIELLFLTGLVEHVLPELIPMKDCLQPVDYHPEGDVLEHTIIALSHLPEDASPELLFATLLHDVGKPVTQTFEDRIRFNCHDEQGAKIAEQILRRLKFSNSFVEHTCSMIGNHMKFMHVQKMRASKLKRFMNLPKFNEHMMLHKADCMSSHEDIGNYFFLTEKLKTFEAEPEKNVISKLPRLITGHDLLSMGFKQGPIFRTILSDIEDQQLEENLSDREAAFKYVKEMYGAETFL